MGLWPFGRKAKAKPADEVRCVERRKTTVQPRRFPTRRLTSPSLPLSHNSASAATADVASKMLPPSDVGTTSATVEFG